MNMGYIRLERETIDELVKYAGKHDAEIRAYFNMRSKVRIGMQRTVTYVLKVLAEREKQ